MIFVGALFLGLGEVGAINRWLARLELISFSSNLVELLWETQFTTYC